MKKPPWGSASDLAALLLRLLIVAYATLIVGFRQGDDWHEAVERGLSAPETLYWATAVGWTIAALACVFWLTWRSLFAAALALACFATVEVLHYGSWFVPTSFTFEPADSWPVELALRLPVVLAIWAATLGFARFERDRGGRPLGIDDLRLPAAVVLLYVVPVLGGLLMMIHVWQDSGEWESAYLLYIGAIAVGATLAAFTLRSPGFPWRTSDRAGARVALLTCGAFLLITAHEIGRHAWRQGDWLPTIEGLRPPEFLAILYIVLLAPVVEEWAFRGLLWGTLERRFGALAALLITSIAFGLLHVSTGPLHAIPSQFVGGLVLGVLRWRTGSVLPCILVHMLTNAVLVSLY